jgi:hypothetical protein
LAPPCFFVIINLLVDFDFHVHFDRCCFLQSVWEKVFGAHFLLFFLLLLLLLSRKTTAIAARRVG